MSYSLPAPVTSSSSPSLGSTSALYARLNGHPRQTVLGSVLLARARTTNLAVLMLSLVCGLSLYINLNHFLATDPHHTIPGSASSPAPYATLSSIERTLPPPSAHLTHLIVLPGHAIFTGTEPLSPSHWILEHYQPTSSVRTFVSHIRRAAQLVLDTPSALLVFSGGQTRARATEGSEASSYSRVAQNLNLFNSSATLPFPRATTEDYALDSWNNLLFSVARFKEFTGSYPTQITVVGHSFKAKRFIDIHRQALRWPSETFQYVGLQPEETDAQTVEQMYIGERKVLEAFRMDSYGCQGSLSLKRLGRNPARRFHPYANSCPELRGLMEWCPENGIDWFEGPLPWTKNTNEVF